MNFEYHAFDDLNKEIDTAKMKSGKKLKEPITINITIEMEKSKYLAKLKNGSISSKVQKIFEK